MQWAIFGLRSYVINVIMQTGDRFLVEGEPEIARNFFHEACNFWPSSAVCFIREAQCHLMLVSIEFYEHRRVCFQISYGFRLMTIIKRENKPPSLIEYPGIEVALNASYFLSNSRVRYTKIPP